MERGAYASLQRQANCEAACPKRGADTLLVGTHRAASVAGSLCPVSAPGGGDVAHHRQRPSWFDAFGRIRALAPGAAFLSEALFKFNDRDVLVHLVVVVQPALPVGVELCVLVLAVCVAC